MIVGGGSNVSWSHVGDDNNHTFLLRTDENALKSRYLKIEAFDYESGTDDRLLGVATIVTKKLMNKMGQKYYARLNLYENNFLHQAMHSQVLWIFQQYGRRLV